MPHVPLLTLLVVMFHLSTQAQTPTPSKTPFVLGETVQLYSEALHENRVLNVYLPPGYSPDSTRKYPVIYLLDGSADEDFIHIVGLVQFGTFPWVQQLPESIVVGIANVDRKRDFTWPSQNADDQKEVPQAGGSTAFIRFIATEVQPYVEGHYRTDTVRTLIGQSLGGLLATEILFKQPELFSHYILVSPSLWWDNESLLKTTLPPATLTRTVYLTVGKQDHPVMVRNAQDLAKKLGQDGGGRMLHLFQLFDEHDHGSILHWAVYDALGWMFK